MLKQIHSSSTEMVLTFFLNNSNYVCRFKPCGSCKIEHQVVRNCDWWQFRLHSLGKKRVGQRLSLQIDCRERPSQSSRDKGGICLATDFAQSNVRSENGDGFKGEEHMLPFKRTSSVPRTPAHTISYNPASGDPMTISGLQKHLHMCSIHSDTHMCT